MPQFNSVASRLDSTATSMTVAAAPATAGVSACPLEMPKAAQATTSGNTRSCRRNDTMLAICLLYTSDAADD